MNNPFKKSVSSLRHAFLALNPRDQKALSALLVIAAPLMLWTCIYRPLETVRLRDKNDYTESRRQFEWMQMHAADVKGEPGATNRAMNNESFISSVTTLAQQYQIKITHAEEAEGSLNMSIESVPFNQLLALLDAIQRDSRIHVSQITLERIASQTGYVSATIVLK